MNDSLITLQGWLGGEVSMRRAGDTPVASFRLACTPRRFSRRTDEWSNAETQWYTVKAWRGLADTCQQSLHRGDPVVVHGRLDLRTYLNGSGVEVSDLEVDAVFVGHDLNRGTSVFTRSTRPGPVESAEPVAPGEEVERVPA